jgi:hypothetical protein
MRIDASGQVGIGTTSPSSYAKLHVDGGSGNNSQLFVTTTDNADVAAVVIAHDEGLQGGLTLSSDKTNGVAKITTNNSSFFPLVFEVRGSDGTNERMRIDTSGNLLVGKTSGALGTAGSAFYNYGLVESVRDANKVMTLNRLTSGGDIIDFRKDGTTVGLIGTDGAQLYIMSRATDSGLIFGTNNIYPYRVSGVSDDTIDIGHPSYRFKDLYLSGSLSDGTTSRTVADIVGLTSSQFLRSDANDTATGQLTFNAKLDVANNTYLGWGGGTSRPSVTGNKSNNRLMFYTGGAERFHIDNDGVDVTGAINTTGMLTVDNDSGINVVYGTSETTNITGYGIISNRAAFYLRPTSDNTQTLYVGSSDASLDWSTIELKVGDNNGVNINGNTVFHQANLIEGTSFSGTYPVLFGINNTTGRVFEHSNVTFDGTANTLDVNGNITADDIYLSNALFHEGDTDTHLSFGTDLLALTTGGTARVYVSSSGVQLGDTGNGYFQPVSGNYGSIQIDGGAHGGYEGYSIGGRAVFMHNNDTATGIYNDVNNHWLWLATHGGSSYMYYNGAYKINTTSTGVAVTGALTATGDITAYYSDERLKNFEGKIDGALDKVSKLSGYYYRENDKAKELGYENDARQVGVSAQEVEAVMPEVVKPAPVDPEYKTVQYEKLVPLLIEAIKELKEEVRQLKEDKA